MRINKLLVLFAFITLSSCKKEKQKSNEVIAYNKEIFTAYQKKNNSFIIAKILENTSDSLNLSYYEIDIATPEGLNQKYISTEKIANSELDRTKQSIYKKFNWKPYNGDNVLFVQIQPKGYKNEFEILDKRQEIENEISEELQNKNLGEWFAGDIGPGGGNMLYTVSNINEAMETTLQVIANNNLTKNVVIGKRVMISYDDWFYEVIYPENFSGIFNTMQIK